MAALEKGRADLDLSDQRGLANGAERTDVVVFAAALVGTDSSGEPICFDGGSGCGVNRALHPSGSTTRETVPTCGTIALNGEMQPSGKIRFLLPFCPGRERTRAPC